MCTSTERVHLGDQSSIPNLRVLGHGFLKFGKAICSEGHGAERHAKDIKPLCVTWNCAEERSTD